MVTYIIVIVALAFAFDFINGFHDSANSIATIVGTRVLSPFAAVVWAALGNFAAALLVGTAVAKAVSSGFVVADIVTPSVIAAGLTGITDSNGNDMSRELMTGWLKAIGATVIGTAGTQAKADHARYPFFDNVEDLMTKLVAGGIVPRGATHAETIDAAYQAAVLHNPETRALINQPQVLLLDEPLTGLDPAAMRRMRERIAQVASEGVAVLLSSHILPLVETLCSRVLIMNRGTRVIEGTLDEIRAGMPVEATFVPVTDDITLVKFRRCA